MKRRGTALQILLVVAVAAVDALIVFDAFAVAYLLRFRVGLFALQEYPPAPLEEYLRATVVVAYLWILLFYIFGLYDFQRHRSAIDIFHVVVKAVSLGTVVILSLTYFYRSFSFSRLVCIYAWVISILLFCGFRIAIHLFRADLYRHGRGRKRVVVVGSRTLARFLIEKIGRQPELGYEIVGAVDREAPPEELPGVPYLGNLGELDQILDPQHIDAVLIAHPILGHFELLDILQACERRGLAIRMVPATYDLLVNYRDFEEVDGVPIFRINEKEYRRFDDALKRAVDLLVTIPLIVLTAPLWAAIAVAIRCEDGGPVFFRQARVGRDGERFQMWKFRTMAVDAEARLAELVDVDKLQEPVFKLEDDPRVTRVGRVLRRTSLDELPQLLNVMRGEMSLVGPRPEEERLVERYNIWERRRLKALPGITGLQQVICRGAPRLRERVKWDIIYLRKRSLALDLWILVRTVWTVLRGTGAR